MSKIAGELNAEIMNGRETIETLRQQLEMAEACLAGDNALIVGLKNDIAEKDAEIERLKAYSVTRTHQLLDGIIAESAGQAREQQLREALQTYIDEHEECTDADDWMAMTCSMGAHHVADEALAQPQDTTALSTMIAKAAEVMRERCVRELFGRFTPVDTARILSEAIRAIPGVTLEDIK